MAEKLISSKGQLQRFPLNIKGLDEAMEGGVPRLSTILIAGTAGTMKSSVCFNAIYKEAERGGNVLYLTLEQSYVSLLNHMINMGFDFNKVDVTIVGSDPAIIKKKVEHIKESKKGHIILSDLGSLRATIKGKESAANWWNIIFRIVKTLKDDCNISALVIDSLNALYVLTNFKDPRNQIFQMFNSFKELDLTTFLISEMPKDGSKYGFYEVEDFLSDGVVVIQLVDRNRKVTREINIAKLRATNASTDVFTLEFGKKGFEALYGGKMPLV
ncbi:MAG: ATPase domain-containing protein [Nanoarchaeota archaeon]|nr:ATPase domain-containing protein [Nanoarchaeota archaeon]